MFPKETNPDLERVRFELRASGVKSVAPDSLRTGIHTRGYLPHVKREGASYFVTFRLADSLPKEVLLKFQKERAEKLRSATPNSAEEINRDYNRKVERYLDQGAGACYLKKPEIADLVTGAIRHFDGKRYVLNCWVVMPNHVHAVLWPMPNHVLSDILQSWKRFTAREANILLDRTGTTFWQPESFNHWIRNDEEKARIYRYVINNPVKAGLCATPQDWRWSSVWPGWKTP